MTVGDAAGAVAAYLKAQVGSMCDDRVFRPSLPDSQRQAMPQACIIVTANGGYQRYGGSHGLLVDPRVQIRCYGSTELEAGALANEATAALRGIVRVVSRNVLIEAVNVTGPMPMVDQDTLWPYALLSGQVIMIEQALD